VTEDWAAGFVARENAFEALVGDAMRLHARGDHAEAAIAVQIAAEYAWRCPFGVFSDPRLETLLQRLGDRLCPADPLGPDAGQLLGGGVLHIATKLLSVGGHSRILCRWIEADRTRTHSIALTEQRLHPLPERIQAAISAGGGRVHDLSAIPIAERARALRGLAAHHRFCVVHQDPADVVPSLALVARPRAWSTIVVDHADHVFWLGTRMADVVAHLRPAAAAMAAAHRGLPPQTAAIIPIPLDPAGAGVQREIARGSLGLRADEVLVLSIASEYKYGSGTPHFLDALEPLIDRHPLVRVLMVGPRPAGRWRAAERRFAGRVRAVGPQPDISRYLAAADLYVDSYPLPSFTSAILAAQHGLPTLGRQAAHPDLAYLQFDNEAVREALTWAANDAAVAAVVERWVQDPGARRRCGQAAAEAVGRLTEGVEWLRSLENAYAQAEQGRPEVTGHRASVTRIPELLAYALADAHHGGRVDGAFVNAVVRHHEVSGAPARFRRAVRTLWRTRADRQTRKAWEALWRARATVRLGSVTASRSRSRD